jgi:hypothetical protein
VSIRINHLVAALAACAFIGAAGCKKKEAPPTTQTAPPVAPARVETIRVTEVQLGNALGEDKRVKTQMTSFSPKDTVFAAVVTEGASPGTELVARWTYQDGQIVNETKRPIAPAAAPGGAGTVAVTEFSIQKPDGWPPGEYKVEISADGKPLQTKTFRVQ